MRKHLVVVLVSVFIGSIALLPVTAHSAEEVIKLKFSTQFPAPHKCSVLYEQWCKDMEKRTNGRVKWSYYPAAMLTPPPQTYDSIVKGIADAGQSVFAYTRGKFPLTEVVDLPLGYKTGYVSNQLINEYYKKFRPKELDEVKVLWLHTTTPMLFMTAKKPVSRLDEVKGLKIRSQGMTAKIVQALGAAPVGMTINETYDALMKGVADGAVTTVESLEGFRLGEVIHYVTQNYGSAGCASEFVVMNKQKWNALPADIKATVEKMSEEYAEKQAKLWDEIDVTGAEFFLQKAGKFVPLTREEDARWAAAMKPIFDEYVKDMKTKGLPGDEALQFCQEYLKKNQK